jgi:hypothetical protein
MKNTHQNAFCIQAVGHTAALLVLSGISIEDAFIA